MSRRGTAEAIHSPSRAQEQFSSYAGIRASTSCDTADTESVATGDAMSSMQVLSPEQVLMVANTSTGHIHVSRVEPEHLDVYAPGEDHQTISDDTQKWLEAIESNYPAALLQSKAAELVSPIHSQKPNEGLLILSGFSSGSEAKVLLRLLSVSLFNTRRRFKVVVKTDKAEKMTSCVSCRNGELSDLFLFNTEVGAKERIELQVFKQRSTGFRRRTRRFFSSVFGAGNESEAAPAEAESEDEKLIGAFSFEFVPNPKTNISGTYYLRQENGERVGEVTFQAAVKPTRGRLAGDEPQAGMQSYLSLSTEENAVMVWRRHWVVLDKAKHRLQFFDFATRKKCVFSWDLAAVVGVEKLEGNSIALENVFKLAFDTGESNLLYADSQEVVLKWLSSFRRVLWGLQG